MKFQQVYFVVDEEFRLLWIGGEWDEAALANGGSDARSNEVLSTSLLSHITDEPTRRATQAMAGPDLTVVSFGGANKAAQVKAFYTPWESAGYGKIVAAREMGLPVVMVERAE